DLRLLLDELADEEEGRLRLMPLEQLQESPSVRIVGPVVISESEPARARRQSDEGAAVHLRSWPHGVKAGPGGQGRGACSDDDGFHQNDCSWGKRLVAVRHSLLAICQKIAVRWTAGPWARVLLGD